MTGDPKGRPTELAAAMGDRSGTESRPKDPEAMARDELIAELRCLRAESAARAHLTDIGKIDEATASRRLAILEEAIAELPVGFMLFDEDDRLVLKNNRFQFYDSQGQRDRLGTSFEDLLRFGIELGMYADAQENPEEWMADRLEAHKHPEGAVVQAVRDGRYIQIEERRLPAGATVGTYTDVSQVKQAEVMRDRAFRELERANFAKSRFLANMSHELRTPLNAIVGFTQFLLSEQGDACDAARRKEYLRDIEFSAKHLASIISDLLDISRVETGQYPLAPQQVSLSEACAQVQRLFARQVAEAGIEIAVSVASECENRIEADRRALHQMLINLLSNAVRFSSPGDRIEIAARRHGDDVEVSVTDQGVGIPAAEISEVIKPFHRGQHDENTQGDGLGLGLALTHSLMELHGGALIIESDVGRGTQAILRFPMAQTAVAEPRIETVSSH